MKQKLFLVLAAVLVIASLPVATTSGQGTVVPQVINMPDQIAGGRDVSITVSDKPASDQPEELAIWDGQVAKFEAMYPNVKIEGLELKYDPTAFIAMIAGDQLPTIFKTYFTEPEKFIGQDAVADLTGYFDQSGLTDVFNANVLAIASQDGKLYGIPDFAYSLELKTDNRGCLAEFMKSAEFGQIFVSRFES